MVARVPIAEAARRAQVGEWLIRRRIAKGELAAVPDPRDRRRKLVDVKSLQAVFELEREGERPPTAA